MVENELCWEERVRREGRMDEYVWFVLLWFDLSRCLNAGRRAVGVDIVGGGPQWRWCIKSSRVFKYQNILERKGRKQATVHFLRASDKPRYADLAPDFQSSRKALHQKLLVFLWGILDKRRMQISACKRARYFNRVFVPRSLVSAWKSWCYEIYMLGTSTSFMYWGSGIEADYHHRRFIKTMAGEA